MCASPSCFQLSIIGFGEKWLGWIKWCKSIARFSILVNGTSSDFFLKL